MTQDVTGNGGFVEVYSTVTGRRQHVPAHWLGDPVLGVGFAKTPFQRELDGDLGPRPREDSTVKDIDAYAEKAGIDLSSASSKTEKLLAVEAAFAAGEMQTGVVLDEPPAVDDSDVEPVVSPADVDTSPGTSPDDAVSSTETPSDGGQE